MSSQLSQTFEIHIDREELVENATESIAYIMAAIFTMNVFDAVATITWVTMGVATEANPLMDELLRDVRRGEAIVDRARNLALVAPSPTLAQPSRRGGVVHHLQRPLPLSSQRDRVYRLKRAALERDEVTANEAAFAAIRFGPNAYDDELSRVAQFVRTPSGQDHFQVPRLFVADVDRLPRQ